LHGVLQLAIPKLAFVLGLIQAYLGMHLSLRYNDQVLCITEMWHIPEEGSGGPIFCMLSA